VAALLATSAVAIAAFGRHGAHSLSLFFVLFPLFAGGLTAFQQAFNAKVAVTTSAPLTATFLNFVVGFGALVAVLGIEHAISGKPLPAAPLAVGHLWIYLGGPVGALFIAIATVVVGPLGVLVFGLFSIVGQLVGAVLLDLLVPTAGAYVGWQTFVAIGVTAGAVALASLSGRTRATS
jgi:transporter family-2 protein